LCWFRSGDITFCTFLDRQSGSALSKVFIHLAESPWLPEYVEIYIRDDLRIPLGRGRG
jgi:hypothetical protein